MYCVACSGHVSGAHCQTSARACMHIRAHSPLTTPPYTSAAALPPPPHTNVDVDACRTQCEGRLAERAGGRPTGLNQLQACASGSSTAHPPPLLRVPLSQERQHKQTRHQMTHAGCGKRHNAAPAGRGHLAPECTVCRAATTGGVPAKYSFQLALPYAFTTRFHIKPSTPETAELLATFAVHSSSSATFAADKWLKQATQCIAKKCYRQVA